MDEAGASTAATSAAACPALYDNHTDFPSHDTNNEQDHHESHALAEIDEQFSSIKEDDEEAFSETSQQEKDMHVLGRTVINGIVATSSPRNVPRQGIDEQTFDGNAEDDAPVSHDLSAALYSSSPSVLSISGPVPTSSPEAQPNWGWSSLSRSLSFVPTSLYSSSTTTASTSHDRPEDEQTALDTEQALSAKLARATHLVVLAHGLHGGVGDLVRVASVLTATYGDTLAILIAKSNHGFLATHEGIDVGGERLGREVIEFARKMVASRKGSQEANTDAKLRFSIIGHSLGGLYARYCVGYLFAEGFFDQWEPYNFITFATPHLGSRRPQRGLNPIISFFTSHLFSRTGRQLMLEDKDQEEPLLYRICERGSPFYQALAQFRRRSIYANVRSDLQVPFSTAAIMPYNPFLSRLRQLRLSEKYSCILDESITLPKATTSSRSNSRRGSITTTPTTQTTDLDDDNTSGDDPATTGHEERREDVNQRVDVEMVDETKDGNGEAAAVCTGEAETPVDSVEAEDNGEVAEEGDERPELFFKNDSRGPELRAMFQALSELEWERVGVRFDNYLSHVNIVCKKTLLEKVHIPLISRRQHQKDEEEELDCIDHIGFGVLRHLADHLLLADEERARINADGGRSDDVASAVVVETDEKKKQHEGEDFVVREEPKQLEDPAPAQQQQQGEEASSEHHSNHHHEKRASSWKVWRWFSAPPSSSSS